MRIGILGASGFLGYDFTRLMLGEPDADITVIATSASNLTNLSRHDIPIRLVSYRQMQKGAFGADFDWLVNFAHPFQPRDGLSQKQQISILGDALLGALARQANLRLIHISTMSVYEPFAGNTYFAESHAPKPPQDDTYASSKALLDAHLLKQPAVAERIMLPRPTIVYGPFCRPWTDGILSAFLSGDVLYRSLDGRMQPLFSGDLCHLLKDAIQGRFCAGPINVAGDEEMTWMQFLSFFQSIANAGGLEHYDGPAAKEPSAADDIRTVINTLITEPAFIRLAKPISRWIPKRTRVRKEAKAREEIATAGDKVGTAMPFVKPFFAEDRLVSRERFTATYPEFAFTALQANRDLLGRYATFRFSDTPFGLKP